MRDVSTGRALLVDTVLLTPRCDGPRFHWTIFIFDLAGDEDGSGYSAAEIIGVGAIVVVEDIGVAEIIVVGKVGV